MRLPRNVVAQQTHTIYARPSPKVTDCSQSSRRPAVEEGTTAARQLGVPERTAHQKPGRNAHSEEKKR